MPIDGTPVIQPVPGHPEAKRVICARSPQAGPATISTSMFDGWLQARLPTVDAATDGPFLRRKLDDIAAELVKKGANRLLDGGPKANLPTLADRADDLHEHRAG